MTAWSTPTHLVPRAAACAEELVPVLARVSWAPTSVRAATATGAITVSGALPPDESLVPRPGVGIEMTVRARAS
jgi:hypothetical protein